MKRTFLKQLFCLSCCAALCLTAVSVFAAENPDSLSSVIDPEQSGTVIIDYQDTVDGNDPVVDAEFTFYKIADLNMEITAGDDANLHRASEEEATVTSVGNQYVSIIPDLVINPDTDAKTIAPKVQSYYKDHPETDPSYTGKTGKNGKLVMNGMELGVYLGMETSPAKEHYASTPFLFQLPFTDSDGGDRTFWNYELTVEPKSMPAGDIMISKEVTGTAGDTSQKFHFKVEFRTTDDSLSVPYEISDGTKGTIRTGDKIELKSGEVATITMLPCGSDYKVTEVEANQDGYKTTATGTSGRIVRKNQVRVTFVNHKDKPNDKPKDKPNDKPEDKPPKPTGHTQTGDNLPVWDILLAAASVFVIGIGLTTYRRKKK